MEQTISITVAEKLAKKGYSLVRRQFFGVYLLIIVTCGVFAAGAIANGRSGILAWGTVSIALVYVASWIFVRYREWQLVRNQANAYPMALNIRITDAGLEAWRADEPHLSVEPERINAIVRRRGGCLLLEGCPRISYNCSNFARARQAQRERYSR